MIHSLSLKIWLIFAVHLVVYWFQCSNNFLYEAAHSSWLSLISAMLALGAEMALGETGSQPAGLRV